MQNIYTYLYQMYHIYINLPLSDNKSKKPIDIFIYFVSENTTALSIKFGVSLA